IPLFTWLWRHRSTSYWTTPLQRPICAWWPQRPRAQLNREKRLTRYHQPVITSCNESSIQLTAAGWLSYIRCIKLHHQATVAYLCVRHKHRSSTPTASMVQVEHRRTCNNHHDYYRPVLVRCSVRSGRHHLHSMVSMAPTRSDYDHRKPASSTILESCFLYYCRTQPLYTTQSISASCHCKCRTPPSPRSLCHPSHVDATSDDPLPSYDHYRSTPHLLDHTATSTWT